VQGKEGDALEIANRLARSRDQIHAGLVRAFREHAQQNTTRAKAEYERVLRLDPRNLTASANLACLLAEATGDYDRALSLARQAHVIESDNHRFAEVYARVSTRSGSHGKGRQTSIPVVYSSVAGPHSTTPQPKRKAVERPRTVPPQPTRKPSAVPRTVTRQPVPARGADRRRDIRVTVPPYAISRHCPRRAELERAAGSLARGNLGEARDIASRLSLNRDHLHAGLVRAFTEHTQQNTTRAKTEYEHVLELDPRNLTASANLACLLAETTIEHERALSLARQAHRTETGNVRFADAHAWVLARSSSHVEGAKTLARLAKQHPTDSLICLHLAWTHLAAGNRREARDELVNVLAITRDQCQHDAAVAALEEPARGK